MNNFSIKINFFVFSFGKFTFSMQHKPSKKDNFIFNHQNQPKRVNYTLLYRTVNGNDVTQCDCRCYSKL